MTTRKNETFFEQKKPWSEIKDALLKCYLKPYIAKILAHGGPVRYIDCFAGAGKFSDGSDGSPLIAINEINDALNFSYAKEKDVKLFFIEKNHAATLKEVLQSDDNLVGGVIAGGFEENFIPLARKHQRSNLFCYIDPFGVKVLDSHLLDDLTKLDFLTIELLINFNSFGFFRWACAHENVSIDKQTLADYSEFDNGDFSEGNCLEAKDDDLNNVLGTSKWKDIVASYNGRKESDPRAGKRAVEDIAILYWHLLKNRFEYVLRIPINIRNGGKTEYYMFFATNHEDGAVLMGNAMGQMEEQMKLIREHGQFLLFDSNADEDPSADMRELLLIFKGKGEKSVRLKRFIAVLYTRRSYYNTEKRIVGVLKEWEKQGIIVVKRYPALTPTGKVSAFWCDNGTKKLQISLL